MKRIILISTACLAMTVAAQKNGGISSKMLNEIQKEQQMTTADRALMNASTITTAIPGIIVQLILIPVIVKAMEDAGLNLNKA